MPEIIIRGAGIAGQVLHRELARSGIRSVLLDVHRFPRDKVCGGLLQNDSWQYLSSLFKLPEPRWIHQIVHYWRTKKISGYTAREPMVFVPRITLDGVLDDQNRSRTEKDAEVNGPIVVLASGIPRGRGDWIGFMGEAEASLSPEEVRMHYGRGIYLGLVPIGEGRGHAALIVKKNFFKGLPDLKQKVRLELGIHFSGELKGTGQINYDFFSDEIAVGDAKMTTHPFLGFGMKHAILSARLCAEHICAGKLAEYPKAHARLFRRQLWMSRLGGSLYDSPLQILLKPVFQHSFLFRRAYQGVHGSFLVVE